jgi:hypothetical protein
MVKRLVRWPCSSRRAGSVFRKGPPVKQGPPKLVKVLGHVQLVGALGAPATGEAVGLEVDGLSMEHVLQLHHDAGQPGGVGRQQEAELVQVVGFERCADLGRW